jgi:hypothetical protein
MDFGRCAPVGKQIFNVDRLAVDNIDEQSLSFQGQVKDRPFHENGSRGFGRIRQQGELVRRQDEVIALGVKVFGFKLSA